MSFTVNLSGGGLLMGRLNSSGMLNSTQEKLQRQQERDNKIAFFEAQKENLKNQKAETLEEIAEKLEMFHTCEDEIAAAKQEYNSSQMYHVMDEAQEQGEKIAEAAEKNKPKTEEERKEEMIDEALGTDENKGMMSEIMNELSELTEEMTEDLTEQIIEGTVGNLDEFSEETLQEKIVAAGADVTETIQTEANKKYVPIDIRI